MQIVAFQQKTKTHNIILSTKGMKQNTLKFNKFTFNSDIYWSNFWTNILMAFIFLTLLKFKHHGNYRILLSIVHTFFIENDAEILPVYYTWNVAFTNLFHKQNIQVKL